MSNRAMMVVVLAAGALVISALVMVGLLNPKPRLVELKGCAGEVFVDPKEVAALVQIDRSGQVAVVLRGNSEPIPACEQASVVAEKLGHVGRSEN